MVDVLGVVHAVVRCDEPKQQIEPAQMNGAVSIVGGSHVKLQLTAQNMQATHQSIAYDSTLTNRRAGSNSKNQHHATSFKVEQ